MLFPDAWERFLAPIPEAERGDLMSAYRKRLVDPDREVRLMAAAEWAKWEGETITLLPDPAVSNAFYDPEYALALARIENHYFVHHGWMDEGQLIANAGTLRDIPAVIVQGRYDVVCPMQIAWALHKSWPEAKFQVVPDAGHSAMEAGNTHELVSATDGFR
jgi:proline iminopeptidase